MVKWSFFIVIFISIVLLLVGSVNAESVEDMIKTANRHNQAGEYEEAFQTYSDIIEIDPNNTWALNNRVFDLGNMARWEESLPALTLALNKSPENVELWQTKAMTLYNLKQYDEAIQTVEQVWKLDYKVQPANWIAETWLLKGRSLVGLGRDMEAIDAFDEAFNYDPNYIKILNEKGIALMNLGKHEQALKTFNQALEINPRYGEAKKNKDLVEGKING